MEAISTGLIAMRRSPGGPNWFHLEETAERVPEGFGEHLMRAFAIRDYLRTIPTEDDLLAARLAIAPDVHLLADHAWAPEGWQVAEARLSHSTGLRRAGNVNSHMTKLLARCDGVRTLREVVAEFAAGLGVDFERVAAPCLPVIRELLAEGFVVPLAATEASR